MTPSRALRFRVLRKLAANWLATLLAAVWGAGRMMPLAGGGSEETTAEEAVVGALLISLSLAMVAVCGLVIWGLRRDAAAE